MAVDRRALQNFDWVLFGLVATLLCAGFVNLVSSTDAQLGELRGIVGPINARTADLDRALRNLDVVGEETGAWLARIDSCRRADHALQDAERRRVIDDPRAWIARLRTAISPTRPAPSACPSSSRISTSISRTG